MTRSALTKADWAAIYRAADGDLTAAVEARVRERMRLAWDQGYEAGWDAGVSDAMDDEPDRPRRNPYLRVDTSTPEATEDTQTVPNPPEPERKTPS